MADVDQETTGASPLRYARRLAAELARRCAGAHALLQAAYLHGSAALGGWIAERSDIDILFIAADDLSDDAVAAAGQLLVAAAADCPGRGLEASLVTAGQAARPAEPWPFVLHTGPGPDGQRWYAGAGTPGDRDLIMHYAVCRAAGITLLGPAPQVSIGSLPRPVILRYLADELDWGLANAAESYVVLNACRAVEFLESGRIVGKVAGAMTALDGGLGPAGLIRQALDQQQARADERPPGQAAIEFAAGIGARLAAAAAEQPEGS